MTPSVLADGAPVERWGAVAAFVLAMFYLSVLAWLGLFVAIPTFGLHMDPVVITSGSMHPGIRPGDIVILRPPDGVTPLRSGTVITFASPARPGLTTHRIVQVNADGTYRTRGDANAARDSRAVRPSEIVGAGRLLVPLLGLPVVWLERAPVWFAAWSLLTLGACVLVTRPPHNDLPTDE